MSCMSMWLSYEYSIAECKASLLFLVCHELCQIITYITTVRYSTVYNIYNINTAYCDTALR